MGSTILNVTFDCAQAYPLAQFWSEVLQRPIDPDNEPGDEVVGIPLESGGDLMFIQVPESKTVKNRVHVCLQPEQLREDEVDRIVALGARLHDDHSEADGTRWSVLLDPEGNEFCVLRSAAERLGD